MINKPNQNCEFGCDAKTCQHSRSDQLDQVILNRHDFELDLEAESFVLLRNWIDNSLEQLEEKFDAFTTFASMRKFHQR